MSYLLPSAKYDAVLHSQTAPPTMSLTPLAVRRITADTKRCLDLVDQGIFWIPNETDLRRGWAVVCGGEDTPYDGGAYCFEVVFPDNYPYDPPQMTFLTNDGRTRFNPNLYRNGKVCLSLLGTWSGEPWSAVQSLGSVLQSIQSAVLTENPLLNEPAYDKHKMVTDAEAYTRLVFHANLETGILGQLLDPAPYLVPVLAALRSRVLGSRDRLVRKARAFAATWDGRTESNGFYTMTLRYRFAELADRIDKL
jgi:ubiquitin-conjugating enzyme E2 Z